jgi:serine/threonine-protein kinase
MLLGTAAYMSPEQAKGLRADHRSDVFSFGVVLYEMLSGRQAFPGETLSDVLAAVLAREPDFSALPSPLNPRLIELLKRCLEKQPRKRWQAVGDLRIELETVAAQPTAGVVTSTVASGRPFWRRAIPFAACAIAASLLTGGIEWTMLRQPEPPVMVTRFRFGLPESHVLTNQGRPAVAISPDGSKVVYVANGQLWVRSMGDLDPRPIAGTEAGLGGVSNPTFSPDGQSIAFGSGSDFTIKRAVVNGGPPITICPVRIDPTGMSWTGETIFYGQGTNGIMRVSANGGTPEQVVTVDDGWSAHGPQLLPGGEWLMFTLAPRGQQEGQIAVQSLTTGDRKVLIDGGAAARFQPTGSLVFARSGVLLAASLDLSRMEVAGKSVPVLEGVARAESTGAHYDVSATGVLAYRSGSAAGSYTTVLALVDRSGKAERLTVRPATYATPRAAPNGRQVAVVSEGQVWIHDLSGASSMRQLTFGGTNQHPVWSPDSQRIAFQSDREGDAGIFSQRADGSDTAIRLTSPEKGRSHIPSSWSSDGDTLLYSEHDGAEYVLWAQSLRDRKATPLDVRSVSPPNAIFRPDGRWIAYKALDKDPGSSVLFVQPFPSTGARYRIASPGNNPMWSADGKELVYGTGAGPVFQAVSITTHPSFAIGNPVPIPRGFVRGNPDNRDFDILPDGRRFVVVVDADDVTGGTFGGPEFVVVVNWAEELKRLVPTH